MHLGKIDPHEIFGPNPLDPHRRPLATGTVAGKRSELKALLRQRCSDRPGVYGMLDSDGRLIYVGKSRQVRTRLRSYFSPRLAEEKPGRILDETATIIWEIAPSEFAALLRELQLIIRWRPRWNVQGQPKRQRLHFICLGRGPVPQAYASRQFPKGTSLVFGPVRGGKRTREAVETINKIFRLRDCSSRQPLAFADQRSLFSQQDRPGCLRYETGSCTGPCIAACTRQQYYAQLSEAEAFLRGDQPGVLAELQQQMRLLAEARHYERATLLRDQWESLQWVQASLQRADAARTAPPRVYQVSSRDGRPLWYLLRDGVVRGVVRRPNCARTAAPALRRLERLATAESDHSPEDYQQLMFLEGWFRLRPIEQTKCLTWEAATEHCLRLRNPTRAGEHAPALRPATPLPTV